MVARTKIVKKKRNTFNRFESDRHIRLDVYKLINKIIEKLEKTQRYRL